MNDSKPVIILAFSNDQDDYLKMIVRERKNIFKALQQHHDKGFIQVHKEENTSIEDIFDLFNRYADRIAIFHYGGHASGSHLQLEAGVEKTELADAGGLAQLMGQQKALQLVFLNGCATQDQVKLLFSCGVKTVIATSVPINDEMATEFAEQFYQALANKATIQKAFQTAKAFAATKYGKSKQVDEFRDLLWDNKKEKPSTDMPWGLYINDNAGEALDWKLPDVKRMVNIGIAVSGREDAPVNQVLIEMLSNELPKHSRKMALFLEDLENGEVDERELPLAIIDSFPLPIGEQLRKLFSPELSAIHVQRLQQLVLTYETLVELLCFTMLSQLWEDRHRNPKLTINPDNLRVVKNFLELDGAIYPTFNYIELMAAVAGIYQENNLDPFVDEFKNLNDLLEQEEFRQAQQFLQEIRARLISEKIAAEEIENLCEQSEKFLGAIMAGFAFIVKYKLTTIKEIKIIKHRHTEPKYRHSQVLLTRTTGRDIMRDTEKEYGSFAECQSVILLKSVKDLEHYLSLSPFVIDENALTGDQNSKLFFYTFHEVADDRYHFQFIGNRKDTLVISDNQYPLLKQQLEAFRRAMLGA
jgi:hypothetical protein